MHGNLEFDPIEGEVLVTGRLNWFTIFFSTLFVSLSLKWGKGDPTSFIFPLFLVGILAILYMIQANRFKNVAQVAVKEWSKMK